MHYIALGMSVSDAALTLVIGIGASLLWLMLLFSRKPNLRLWAARDNAGPFVFFARNSGVARAVQVEARLWMVMMTPPRNRYVEVPLKRQRLFTLNGQWQVTRRPERLAQDGIYGDEFGFEPAAADLLEQLRHLNVECGIQVRLLFQVWAQHGFTNFGRSTPAWFAFDPDVGLLKCDVWRGAHSTLYTLIQVSKLQLAHYKQLLTHVLRARVQHWRDSLDRWRGRK